MNRDDELQEPLRMVDALHKKLSGFFEVADETAADLVALCSETRTFDAKETVAASDEAYRGVFLIQNGWAARSRILENGARQVVNVGIPGDFLCLNALIFERSDFDIVAKTPLTAYYLDPVRLRATFGRDPDLAAAIFWVSAHEESILAERIVSLGRRSVRARLAHVLCEIISRVEIIEETNAQEMAIPLTQEDFSDILGVSLVHTNKTLRALDREEVVTFRKGVLVVNNRTMLERIAGFDSGYLHFTRTQRPRPTLIEV